MRIPEQPFDGDAPEDGAPSYEWLDEWLCEYVDGTMDPSLEAVFEQYVEANPDLKAHVERLRQTRELLCGCDLPEEPSPNAQAEVCSEVEKDLLQSSASLSGVVSQRPVVTLGIASTVAVALVVGFLAGSMLVDPATLSPTPVSSAVEQSAPPQTVEQDPSTQQQVPPHLEDSFPTLRIEASSFSAGETVFPRRTAGPVSTMDTLGGGSTLTAAGTR